MHESLKLFKSIVNNEIFLNTSIILFLNKKDIFDEKIKKYPLTVCFPEYDGDNTYSQALVYIKRKFEDQKIFSSSKQIYSHETCSVDTEDTRLILESVIKVVIRSNLIKIGLL